MAVAKAKKFEKPNRTRFIDILRRSRELSKTYEYRINHKDADERVIRRCAGCVISECEWMLSLLESAGPDVTFSETETKRLLDIKKHLTDMRRRFSDEVARNQFIPQMPVRIVPDMAWLAQTVEQKVGIPKNEVEKIEELEPESDDDE